MHEVSTKIRWTPCDGGRRSETSGQACWPERSAALRGGIEGASYHGLPRAWGFGIEACHGTWGQREPPSEVDQEVHTDQVAAAVFTPGVRPGSAGGDYRSSPVAARQRGDGGFAGGLR